MKRQIYIGIAFVLLALAASGCGLAPQSAAPATGYAEPGESGGGAPGFEEAPVQPAPGGGADLTSASDTATRMVIRTASLDLIVPSTEQAMDSAQGLATELGGYVVSLNTTQYQEGVQATVVIRIPAESFDTALATLKGLATTIRSESVAGQDVTEEYVDLGARLRHLQAVEQQLLEFLDEAEDTEATLAVYAQLSVTQGEIEQVSGRMQYLEDQAALATITVSLTPDALAQPLETGGWNLPSTVRGSVEALLGVLEFLVKATIVIVIVILPTLIFIAAPIVALILIIRWLVRRRRRKAVRAA
jgi:hypothetical protein